MNQPAIDLSAFNAELGEAAAALQAFARGPGQRAADQLGVSFERAGRRIAGALASAAADGENAFKRMARIVLEELARVAIERIFTQGGDKKRAFFGARAEGGPVNIGGAYLVGERGPELFAPRQAGVIAARGEAAVTINFNFGAGESGEAVMRHRGQIAAAIARAVAYGRRNL